MVFCFTVLRQMLAMIPPPQYSGSQIQQRIDHATLHRIGVEARELIGLILRVDVPLNKQNRTSRRRYMYWLVYNTTPDRRNRQPEF